MNRTGILKTAKPILFNADMVRAILEDRKTVTRRVIKLKYSNTHHEMHTDKYGTRLIEIQDDVEGETFGKNEDGTSWRKLLGYIEPEPPYKKGDYLYVRETWQYAYDLDGNDQMIEETGRYVYAADNSCPFNCWVMPDGTHRDCMPWRPSIHMPKEAARIFLRVTDVRAERLQDMSCRDFWKEGIIVETKGIGAQHIAAIKFKKLWNSTVPKKDLDKYGWNTNPWVWVIEFERVEVDSR